MNIAFEKLIQQGLLTENPIIEPIAAVSVGLIDGEVKLDLDYSEDSTAQVDSNVVMTKSSKIIEFQTTAEGAPFDKSQLDEIYNFANDAIQKIISLY